MRENAKGRCDNCPRRDAAVRRMVVLWMSVASRTCAQAGLGVGHTTGPRCHLSAGLGSSRGIAPSHSRKREYLRTAHKRLVKLMVELLIELQNLKRSMTYSRQTLSQYGCATGLLVLSGVAPTTPTFH